MGKLDKMQHGLLVLRDLQTEGLHIKLLMIIKLIWI